MDLVLELERNSAENLGGAPMDDSYDIHSQEYQNDLIVKSKQNTEINIMNTSNFS